nr:hypothetical protein [Rhizobium leguminosarum]
MIFVIDPQPITEVVPERQAELLAGLHQAEHAVTRLPTVATDRAAEETTQLIVQSLFGADDYIAIKDGGEQVIHNCPECSVEAYVESSDFIGCFFCDYSIADECARCRTPLSVANQSVNNSSLCDYCDHVANRLTEENRRKISSDRV